MKVDSLQVSEHTPLLLTRMETLPTPEIRATARHDHSTATVNTHMTVVTTPGIQPEMHDQQSDTTSDA
jgi:hypothetical protein